MPLLLVLALILSVARSVPANTDKVGQQGDTREGKVISFRDGQLRMEDRDGNERRLTLDATARVTIDGKSVKGEELRPGMRIRVTTPKQEANTGIRIEGIDKNRDFTTGMKKY